jgi:creatinine amidohydrolase
MNWEELTDADFAKAAKKTGLCILSMGVLERHGPHLPLGTDVMAAHAVCTLAARREPAVVFPPFYFGQIYEARHFPGTLAIKPSLMMELLENVCDEIARNGFEKILIYNGHGGNSQLIRYFAQTMLAEQKPYTLYHVDWLADPTRHAELRRICPTPGGHADEEETSMMLAVAPQLVKMDRLPNKPSKPLGRMKHLPGIGSGIWWYADYPDHYAGDGRPANADKAKQCMEIYVDAMAKAIRMVKADKVVPALCREFFQRADRVAGRKKVKGRE